MRITQVLLREAIGGAESLVDSLNAEFQRLGHETRTIYVDPPGAARGRLARFLRVRRSLAASEPDVVFSHSAIPSVFARAATGRPVVTVLHSAVDDFAEPTLRLAERILRRRTTAVVAVSPDQRRDYVARFGEAIPVALIPNGIRAGIEPAVRPVSGPVRVTTLARVAAQKDPQTWIDVARSLTALDGLQLRWFGPDDPSFDLASAAREFEDVAAFEGPTADVPRTLAESDLLFHTSTSEAHPIALLEAAAAGLPILCTESVAGTLPSDIPVVTYPDRQADAAVDRLRRMRDDLERLSDEAHRRAAAVHDAFSIERCAAAYLELAARSMPAGSRAEG